MNKKKIIKIIVIIISVLLVIGLSLLTFKLVKNFTAKKEDKVIEITQEESTDDSLETIEENLFSDLILFNASTKEISYQKDEEGDIYYINGDKLSLTKEHNGNILKGLVPYKLEERLFFVDLDFNTLVEIRVINEELSIEVILKELDIDLGNINEMSIVNNIMYLILDEGNILEVELEMTNKMVKKYKTELSPSKLFKLNGEFYFMDRAHLVKSIDQGGKLTEVKRLELGAMLSDFKVEEGYLYALSMFGKKENNSVLMKVHLADLEVKDIMALKGLDSVFIGMEDKIAYIGQKDSIKEVNIETFTPLRAFKREKDELVQYSDFNLYKLSSSGLERIDLKNMKIAENIETNFNNFYLVRENIEKIGDKIITTEDIETDNDINKAMDFNIYEADEEEKQEDTPEIKLLIEKIRTMIKEDYTPKNGEELSEEDLDKLTDQIMEDESILELFLEERLEGETSLNN